LISEAQTAQLQSPAVLQLRNVAVVFLAGQLAFQMDVLEQTLRLTDVLERDRGIRQTGEPGFTASNMSVNVRRTSCGSVGQPSRKSCSDESVTICVS
jgi:hypothetical protein